MSLIHKSARAHYYQQARESYLSGMQRMRNYADAYYTYMHTDLNQEQASHVLWSMKWHRQNAAKWFMYAARLKRLAAETLSHPAPLPR